jgi:hypothetical protein
LIVRLKVTKIVRGRNKNDAEKIDFGTVTEEGETLLHLPVWALLSPDAPTEFGFESDDVITIDLLDLRIAMDSALAIDRQE